jgi:protein-tyrosine phosphatase
MDAALAAGNAVLVHCASGAHRSASVVCAYLMHRRRTKLDAVYPEVFGRRPLALPVYWHWLVDVWEPQVLALAQPAP